MTYEITDEQLQEIVDLIKKEKPSPHLYRKELEVSARLCLPALLSDREKMKAEIGQLESELNAEDQLALESALANPEGSPQLRRMVEKFRSGNIAAQMDKIIAVQASQTEQRLKAAEAERDRLKAALENVRDYSGELEVQRIARQALEGTAS